MSSENLDRQRYTVSIFEPPDLPGQLDFTYVPKGLQQARRAGEPPKPVAQYVTWTRQDGGSIKFDWKTPPNDPGTKTEIEHDIVDRINTRNNWINRVTGLVADVEQWAQGLGWATRRIEKQLEDSYIGEHRLFALLMQEDLRRILLEPIGRGAPGAEGVVDLYLLPAYDDIASLYYYEDRWNIHYLFPGDTVVATPREANAIPLSKESLQRVLDEMKAHAA